ncbi:MAG TPA: DUF2784 domain-containing protein [Gemmata sp.]|jgi:hypothetical protein|nr:DUF2784 domain-containing protein [Gemmata sp.]
MWYGICADLMVAIHVSYIAYVVLGQLLIILAAPMKWQWARNPWFRFTHLAAIGIVAYEAIRGLRCPLTVWEEQLRELAGQVFNGSETFMGRVLHDLMFIENQPEVFFTTMYLGVLVLVIQGLVMYPPRMFRVGRREEFLVVLTV